MDKNKFRFLRFNSRKTGLIKTMKFVSYDSVYGFKSNIVQFYGIDKPTRSVVVWSFHWGFKGFGFWINDQWGSKGEF